MAEKKLTKAEQKKLEVQAKRDFTQAAFTLAMEAVVRDIRDVTTKVQIQVSGINRNHYIRFSNYGRTCVLLLYKNGNVAIRLEEMSHDNYEAQLFTYEGSDEVSRTAFLQQLRDILAWLVPTYYEKVEYNFHTFMDYVSGWQDIVKAHHMVEAEFCDAGGGGEAAGHS